MTLEEAKQIAFNAAQEKLLNLDYRPTKAELQAVDMILIEQARVRLAGQEPPAGDLDQ